MRFIPRSPLALALVAVAAPTSVALAAAPAAVAQSTTDACKKDLNPDRRSVYRFKDGKRTLGFGRVVVTATKSDRHLYCFRVDFDERRVFNSFGESGYERRDGKWVNVGGLGDSGSVGGSYRQSMAVPDKYRKDRSYAIRHEGRWYRTISISRRNP
jgi:hypothetical protein